MCGWKNKYLNWLSDENVIEIPFDKSGKFILFSDAHRGVNDWSDDFARNQALFFHALGQYFDNGFTCIELGDSDELWENRDFDEIRYQQRHIFWQLKKFYEHNRYYMIFGNHDITRKQPAGISKSLHYFTRRTDEHFDETYRKSGQDDLFELFPRLKVHEAIRLRYTPEEKVFLLVHGHQADWFNYKLWWVGRFFVRFVWRWLQNLGFRDPTSPAKCNRKAEKLDKKMATWADKQNFRLIAGHTHKPFLSSESRYINTGSCVHPRCITGIKIEEGKLNLIKWWITVKKKTDVLTISEEYLVRGVVI